jgi:hypothetical protein
MKLARLGFAKSGDHADCLHRGEAAHQANHRAEHTNFRAAIAVIGIMGITNETPVAGLIRLPPAKRADLSMKLANRRRNQRYARCDAQIIDDQPRRKIIASVDHDINAVEQSWAGFAGHPLTKRLHRNIGVKLADDSFHHVDLGRGNITLGIKYLALKIRAADNIIINHAQPANASGGKILDCRAADPTSTDNQDMRFKQVNLPCPTNLLQDDMAGIAVKLFVGQVS